MLSVPKRWSVLYFNIFDGLCAGGTAFVIYYGIISRQPDESAMDAAADMLIRLAAVPIVAALLTYLLMRGRDFIMKTWETFRRERYNKGREEGREEGIALGTQRAVREIRERLAQREASQRGERDDWLDEILSELSENGAGEKRRPRS